MLEAFRQSRPMICDASELQARRERLLPPMREQVAALAAGNRTAARFRNRALVSGGLALAAGLALWLNFSAGTESASESAAPAGTVCTVGTIRGEVHRTLQGQTRRAYVGAELAPTEAIHTSEDALAKLRTPRGVGLNVDGKSDLEFMGRTLQGEQVRLLRGRVFAEVPKLGKKSFSIVTPDVLVTVHGTRFSVDVASSKSCVSVTEGLVAVHAGTEVAWLNAGDSWGCERAREETAPPAATEVVQSPTETTRAGRARTRQGRTPSSTLTAENKLFQAALLAQKQGEFAEAMRSFKLFVSRYPNAPLAGQAREHLRQLDSN